MQEFKPITDELAPIYWDGPSNWFARYYAFLQQGLGLVNEAKNYILIIFGALWTNKIVTFFGITIGSGWIIAGSIVGVGVLIYLGRWKLYKANKAVEFITNRHGSVTGYNSYNMQCRQLELLEQILKELKHNKEDISQ